MNQSIIKYFTNTPRHLLGIIGLCFAGATLQAQEASKLPKKAEELRESYLRARARAVDPIDKTYVQALQKLLTDLTRAGDLDGALAIKKEIARFNSQERKTSDANQDDRFCLRFEGRNSQISIPHNSQFYPSSKITVECWFKTKMKQQSGLVDLRGREAYSGGSLFLYEGHVYFNGRRRTHNPQIKGGFVADDLWHHAAFTWDGTTAILWLDGKKQGTVALADFPDSKDSIKLGYLSESFESLDGTLDEVRISKVVRYTEDFTPAAILNTDEKTVAYWKISEGSGLIVNDLSGNGHKGELSGTPPPQWTERKVDSTK
jgi:hypothetical protein